MTDQPSHCPVADRHPNDPERHLGEMLDRIPDAFFELDRDWRYTYVNQSYERLFGRRRDDLLGRTLWECFPRLLGSEVEHHLRRALRDQVPVRFEAIAPTRGTWIAAGVFPSPEGMSIYVQDIEDRKRAETKLRQSEARYRQLVETAQEGIWMIDAGASTSYANRAMAEMLGYTPQEMIGRSMFDFMDEAAHREAESRLAQQRQGIASRCDFRFRRRDGSDFHAQLSTNPILGDNGEYQGTLAMVSDVTERRRAEAERSELLQREQRARAEAETANRRKDQFLAVLSHELRTPLTPVLARLALMKREDRLSPSLESGLEMIRRNVELEARLIDDLLDITRLARGQLKLHLENVDLHVKIQAALAIYENEIAARRQRVTLELNAAEHRMRGDAVRLQQIFWNLISNAVKYTPEGGRITIRSSNFRSGGDGPQRIAVQVIDTGIGIEPEVMPRLFDPFEQGEQTLSRRYGGLGLGLSISRALAKMHGGTITAESGGHGKGATFTVELPVTLAAEAESAAARPPAEMKPEPAAKPRAAAQRILLVDDNEDTLRVMARLLKSSGHQVITADSVASAIGASDQGFDLLVTDIGLPDGTGWELMRQLRQRGPVRGIAISGFSMEEDVRRSRDCGFVEHLCKPISADDLESAIERATPVRT